MVNLCSPLPRSPPRSPATAPRAANADPAMFVVRDADTTVYLFGTFHALDGESEWFNDEVRDAFEQSNELVLETLLPEGPGRRRGRSADAGQRAHRSRPPLHSLRPRAWRSTPAVAGHAGRQRRRHGAAPRRRSRRQAGRGARDAPVPAQHVQLACRAAAAPLPQRKAGQPVDEPSRWRACRKAMAEMQSAWKRGDQSVFVRMLGQLEPASPDTYRMMFTERNARWADWIAARHADARARCSSRSAPAISPARTACSSASPRRASTSPRASDLTRRKLAFPSASCTRARLPGHGHPWRRGAGFLAIGE